MQGILMKRQMIAATVEGRKTNTRRAEASLREINNEPDKWVCNMLPIGTLACKKWIGTHYVHYPNIKPRYRVGETVYIKEAYSSYGIPPNEVAYYKDEPKLDISRIAWHNPLFMPEWAARHFIFIEAVRAERLQEISEEDAIAEGMKPQPFDTCDLCPKGLCSVHQPVLGQFRNLWDSINPKYPWENNDWVWRYQFRLSTGIVARERRSTGRNRVQAGKSKQR